MTMTIAISGKGGTGKTTMAALMLRCLIEHTSQAILAVDADPNACLGLTLGLEPVGTIADLRDDVTKQQNPPPGGMGKLEAFELGCHHLITEAKGFDLLTMGRPEGPKCYCAANHVLRNFLDQLTGNYGYVITDNEAGMEHLSRRTTNNVDLLVIVAEPTRVGVLTAQRIIQLTASLPIAIGRIGVLWNRIDGDVTADLNGAGILGSVPFDEAVADAAMKGNSIFDLPADSMSLCAIRDIWQRQLNENWV